MTGAIRRPVFPAITADDDDRPRRRDRACVLAGMVTGVIVGGLAGVLAQANTLLLAVAGVVAGGIVGRLVALRISADEWDPQFARRSYVGVSDPDDDLARD
jgi:hypothetical protein